MKVEYTQSFVKDLKQIRDKHLLKNIRDVIIELEQANYLRDLPNIKYMVNSQVYYRIRVGEFRIGIKYENNIIFLVRCLHRKDIYKKFP